MFFWRDLSFHRLSLSENIAPYGRKTRFLFYRGVFSFISTGSCRAKVKVKVRLYLSARRTFLVNIFVTKCF